MANCVLFCFLLGVNVLIGLLSHIDNYMFISKCYIKMIKNMVFMAYK